MDKLKLVPEGATPVAPFPRLSSEERVYPLRPVHKVVILGMGDTTDFWKDKNYDTPVPRDPNTEIWTINSGCLVFQHDVVFNMHDLVELDKREPKRFRPIYDAHDKPVVTVCPWDGAGPNVYEYPLGEVVAATGQRYFANGISYMVAFAIACGAKAIELYGCDYNYQESTQYEKGRCNLEFWLGYAAARGIAIEVAPNSTLVDMVHRQPGQEGAQGYGAVYGYFHRQPQLEWVEAEGGWKLELKGFEPNLPDMKAIEEAINGSGFSG